jgi:adenylosuccinate lyase
MAKRLNLVMDKLEVDEEKMQYNLLLTKGAIAAEPLYLLLEKYGYKGAHEKAKLLAHHALAKQLSLYEVAQNDKSLAIYWEKFSDQEHLLIKHPEDNYTGLAAKKALAIYNYWRKELQHF